MKGRARQVCSALPRRTGGGGGGGAGAGGGGGGGQSKD